MDDRSTFDQDGGYEALSRRVVDIVLDALGDRGGRAADTAPELLRRAEGQVRDELRRAVETQVEGLRQVNEELRVVEEELRLQQEELATQNQDLHDAQETARTEHRRYQELFDFAPDGYLVTDLAAVIGEANRAASRYLGVSQGFLVGKPLILFVDSRDHDVFLSQLQRLSQGEVASVHNWRLLLRPRGAEPFYGDITVASVCDREGAPTRLRWMFRDITERVEVECERDHLLAQSIRDREALTELTVDLEGERGVLSMIMDSTHAQIAYLDPEFNFVRVNAACCRGLGRTRAELIGRNHFDLFPNDENQAIFEQVRDTGEAVVFQARPFVFRDQPERGTTYWDWALIPVKDREDHVRGMVLSTYEVTERERARQAREARLSHLRTLVEVSERVLAEMSVEGVLQQVVDAARELTGARIGTSGYGYQDGVFQVRATSRAQDALPCPPGEAFAVERGGVYMDLIESAVSVRLTGDELCAHPAWCAPLRGLLGARLVDHDGQPNGLIMVSDKVGGDFTVEDEALLVQLATLTTQALHRIEARMESDRLRRYNTLILNSAGDGILGLDRDGRIAFANPAAAAMIGWTAEELIGKPHHDVVHHTQVDGTPYAREECLIQATLADGVTYSVSDEVFWRKDGTSFPVAYASTPIMEEGDVAGVVLVFRDIMERKQAREALRRYAERLRVLRETERSILAARTAEEIAASALSHMQRLIPFLRASVTLFDREAGEMSLLAVHPGATGFDRAWRYPLQEDPFLAKLGEGQVHAVEDLRDVAPPSTLIQVLQTQGVRAYVNVPLIVQGALIGSLNLGMAVPEVPGEDEIEVAQEIADELAIGIQQARLLAQVQHHAEELERQVRARTAALRVSQARFHAVFEEAAIGIALVNRKGRILDSNPALQRMLGYERDELEGMVFSELAHPDNVADDADLYDELIVGKRTHYQVEGRYVRKDGQPIDANLTVSLVHPAKGRSRFAIALVEDVTERKQAQAALIESEKLALTGKMAASLAHEINNPLQSVIGCLSLAEEDLAEGKDALQYVEIALEELERAADLIARMRDLSRQPEAGEQEPTDVNALVERVLTLTKKRCQERHVEVGWKPEADLPTPSLLVGRMQQVFLNLVLNAVDAMPDGGRLEVRTGRTNEPKGVQIRFADSGVGIPADDLPHLFEPFYTTKATGLGLGLYISHGIVKDHGGRMDVESVEGEGTVFSVWLPA
jgi:PAS domain S-box-containing protein